MPRGVSFKSCIFLNLTVNYFLGISKVTVKMVGEIAAIFKRNFMADLAEQYFQSKLATKVTQNQ